MIAQNSIVESGARNNRRAVKEAFFFEGIDKANGTIFPDVLLDKVMPFLTPAEWKVCSYIVRRTFGWKKEEDDISLDQICNGIVKRDGTRLDFGTQMDKKTVIRALKGLETKGVIATRKNYSSRRGFEATTYSLRFKGQSQPPALVEKAHKVSEHPVSSFHKLRIVDNGDYPSGTDAEALVEKSPIQITSEQTTKKQIDSYTTNGHNSDQISKILDLSVWGSILLEVKRQVPKASYDAWLDRSYQIEYSESDIVVAVPTETDKDCIERRLGFLVQRVALRVSGRDIKVRFVVESAHQQ